MMSKEGQTLRRTKIICTIGPSSSALSTLRKMAEAGMDVARINFSHGNYESHLAIITAVREAAQAVGRPIALMLDLQGPKVRVGELPEDGLELTPGVEVVIRAGVISAGPGEIPVPYDRLAVDVKRGDRILLDDGRLELEVWEAKRTLIRCKVVLGGRLLARKG
ncbi:pyruvate kinase, partial [Patescibacteria group bacterium]|nr:pyruvate kinase [Patescibacteria group bacterium]